MTIEIMGTEVKGAEITAVEPSDAHAVHHDKPGEGTYVTIFVILAVLTLIELVVAYLPGVRVPLLLGLAAGKAWLVIQYYMHLRYEARWLTWVFIIPVISGAIITALITPLVQ